VLAEYFDYETECTHLIWLPTSILYELPSPMQPRTPGFKKNRIGREFLDAVESIISLFARKTLVQFFVSSCKTKALKKEH
jgi:hypothetical protein